MRAALAVILVALAQPAMADNILSYSQASECAYDSMLLDRDRNRLSSREAELQQEHNNLESRTRWLQREYNTMMAMPYPPTPQQVNNFENRRQALRRDNQNFMRRAAAFDRDVERYNRRAEAFDRRCLVGKRITGEVRRDVCDSDYSQTTWCRAWRR